MNETYWVRRLIVSAFEPIIKEQQRVKREIDHHWPLPVPQGCRCQDDAPKAVSK